MTIPSLEFEQVALATGPVVGVDEVGRGALAGPVCVGAVLVTSLATPPPGVADSKVLTPARRAALVHPLKAWAAAWGVGSASAEEIDRWGLRVALALACDRALAQLAIVPATALIDGNLNLLRPPVAQQLGVEPPPPIRFAELPVQTVIKGDARCASIAAAAIVAKEFRDALMVSLDEEFPQYEWAGNKGYGSPGHL